MGSNNHPTFGNGKICYIEMPANDINAPASFYETVFNWNIRKSGDGSVSFDDAVTEVSGTWVPDRRPGTGDGFMIHIMVYDIKKSMEAVIANGGRIIQDASMDSQEITAKFADPAGNILGMYQHSNK